MELLHVRSLGDESRASLLQQSDGQDVDEARVESSFENSNQSSARRRNSFDSERGGQFQIFNDTIPEKASKDETDDYDDAYLPLIPTTAASPSNQSVLIQSTRNMPDLFVQSPIEEDRVNKSYSTLNNEEFKVLVNIRSANETSIALESNTEPDFHESNFVCKTDSTMPRMMAIDMLLSSIDISYFALPMVIQETGWFLTMGFFFQMMYFSLMAA